MAYVFSPPVDSHRVSNEWQPAHPKRKRVAANEDAGQGLEEEDEGHFYSLQDPSRRARDLEYTAVISPLERLQRRTAGQPLDQTPPPLPFPHAGTSRKTWPKWSFERVFEGSQSLRLQHLAALTAIVHRTLLQGDFPRASRAIGLLFREDAIIHGAAARSHGLMSIAAEVLLRHGSPRDLGLGFEPATFPFTTEGFEKAKRFYERLIVRHPYHKSWPGSINAIDFYLALFNIWIYVVHAESSSEPAMDADEDSLAGSAPSSPSLERPDTHSRTQVRELARADEIASRMDSCMASVPFMDEPELIRLRAMVALWIADLHEKCALRSAPTNDQVSSIAVDSDPSSCSSRHVREAAEARDRARGLVARLKAASQARSDDLA